jgi:hypothetical protein
MTIKEESSFLQKVESRLDSIFAEDTQLIKEKDFDAPVAVVEEVSIHAKQENIRKTFDLKEANPATEVSLDEHQTQDKSTFISEIEKRFSAIFGDDDKNVNAISETEKPDDIKNIIAEVDEEENKNSAQPPGGIPLPASSVIHSPFKNMKSIVLSLEGEINDQILKQLEDEVNKLDLLYREHQRELFDLKREKKEQEAFLSTFADAATSLPVKGIVQTKGPRPSLAEKNSVLEAAYGELDGLELEMPAITDAQGAKPLESFDLMTRFDETTKSDGHGLANTHMPEEKKILTKQVPENKTGKARAYDFAPEMKSAGIGRWIWILIIPLIVLFIGYFWLYPERGGKTIEIIKSYIPVSKTNQGATLSSIQGINLIHVRQKLIYNMQLGRSIRVIEGIAENSTPRPVSKIKIVANLYNAEGTVLASTESFGGNIIIDEKLESLDAKGILAALKDVKTMEDRVQPKGQIPFMIVFASEPAGVFRLSVLPVDFKKH